MICKQHKKFWLFSVYPLADGAVPQNASFVVLLPPLLKLSNRERRGAEAKLAHTLRACA
jgi:hypothetical protein